MAAAYLEPRELAQGTTYTDTLAVTDSNGDPIDYSEDYSALLQIRAGTVDSGAPVLLELVDGDGVYLADGISIEISAEQTQATVSATGASRLWAELDLRNTSTGDVTSFRWPLIVLREYAREES
jgi:hypothetical protein